LAPSALGVVALALALDVDMGVGMCKTKWHFALGRW